MDTEKNQEALGREQGEPASQADNAPPPQEDSALPVVAPGSLYVEPEWTRTSEGRNSHESKRKAIIFAVLVPTFLVLTVVLRQMTNNGYVVLTPVALALIAGVFAGWFWHRGGAQAKSHREEMAAAEGVTK